MKQLLTLILIVSALSAAAQGQQPQPDKNVFLNTPFWKTMPNEAAVKAEVDKGNDPTEMNRSSFDPVVLAINAGAPNESIKYLLTFKGNDVNKITHDGRTYLIWASQRGNAEMVEYLLGKGAKVDVLDSRGYNAVNFAASGGQRNTKVYDLLIANGANLQKDLTPEGANALLLAVASDKDFTLTNYFISKGLSLNSTDLAGNTAFSYVARSGNIELLKVLLVKGVKYNDNAIIMASQTGGRAGTPIGLEMFEYLESLKLNPVTVNANGENALHFIARRPKQDTLIRYFLSKGVDVNKADNDGNTPFMLAAASNREIATLNLLAPSVKNINQVNKKGASALSLAVRNNSPEVVALLLEKGADVKVKDAAGDNMAAYLVQSYNGARGSADFDTKIKLLSDKGFDITKPQDNGNTLFHLAIAKNDLAFLKRVEEMKIDINAKNKEGLTVLHKAAMTAKDDVILKYLVSAGARKDLVTEFKETPFDLAKENESLTRKNVSIAFLK
jgi:ankyrin repeat protein